MKDENWLHKEELAALKADELECNAMKDENWVYKEELAALKAHKQRMASRKHTNWGIGDAAPSLTIIH